MSPNPLADAAAATFIRDVPAVVATAMSKAAVGVDIPTPTDAVTSILATATSVLAAAVTTAITSSGDSGRKPSDGEGECRLLGPFALIVQLALGGLALMSLVYKRWRERPQRPIKIWAFDASKQVVGSVLVHIANVFMSMLTSGRFSIKLEPMSVQVASRLLRRDDDPYTPNPCSFYLLNLAIDTTIGIPILILLLRITTGLVAHTPLGRPAESIQSGHYGNPPRVLWWLKQSVIYFCGLFGMKICVLIIFLMLPWISRIGDWALRWTEGNERLQIVFVMMLFPLIMNGMQYYIIDSFIKKNEVEHERLLSDDEDDDDSDSFDHTLAEEDDQVVTRVTDNENSHSSKPATYKDIARKDPKSGSQEYDPEQDGHSDQTLVWSSSSNQDRGKPLPKELIPPE